MRLAVVVPFLNEAEHLGDLLESIAAQHRPPDQLVLVDDGSEDASPALAEDFAQQHSYATVLRRPRQSRSGDRLARAAELVAFQWAVERLTAGWDVVAKLDGDLRLPPITFAYLLERLEEDPRLGIAGSYLTEEAPTGRAERIAIGDGHVHGATKFYRRACFEQITPIPAILGWDTIDELRAQVRGWDTRSFALPGGDPLHLRPRGSYDGALRAQRRFGECAYAFGEPLALAVAQGVRQGTSRRGVVSGAHYVAGWAGAALRRQPRAEREVRAYVRREQWGRVRRRLLRGAA